MVNPITCSNQSLPLSVDININVTKQQFSTTVDLSTIVFVSSTGPLPHGAGRIQYYDSITSVEEVWGTTSEAYIAATAFFDQPARPETFAIAQAYDTPQPAFLVTGATGALAAFTPISDGAFVISIDGDQQTISGLDFTTDTSLDDVAATIQAGLQLIGTGGYTAATVVASNATSNQFTITSGTTGDTSTITDLSSPVSGTDISGVGLMNGQDSALVQGYTPTTFTNELTLIQQAASCSGRFVFAWTLDATYRDTQDQLDLAAFTLTNQFLAASFLQTNNVLTLDPDFTTDNASVVAATDNFTANFTYDDSGVDQYPEVAIAAVMLSVDYGGINTVGNAKFENLIGMDVTPITETDLNVLNNKRCNVFTTVNNNVRAYREGIQSSSTWYTDDYTNISNFLNELSTAVLNVFTSNFKVPYTPAGITLLYDAEAQVCVRYITNGSLSSRDVTDTSSPTGIRTIPPYVIIFPDLSQVSQANREARLLQGNEIQLQLSGAINKMDISVIVTE